jgi:DNA-binding NtrC family response regulator
MPRGDGVSTPDRGRVVNLGERSTPDVLVGNSPVAQRLVEDIKLAADATCVLIEAEAGLDVAEVAKAIHARGRRGGPFIAVECAAADPASVERELFGDSLRRASTELETVTARSAIAVARNGTLYLGDLSELSAPAQARLGRVARDGEVRIAGGAAACRLDICLIASTSADADVEAEEGRLRRDLLRHLARVRVRVPPVRQRPEDVSLIIEQVVSRLCDRAGASHKTFTQPALTLLSAMPWRGNLVELRDAMSHLVVEVAQPLIQLEDVLGHIRFEGTLAPRAPSGTLRAARQEFERDYITLVLQHHRWRMGDAARTLGIQRTNLYRKARQLGIPVGRLVQHT